MPEKRKIYLRTGVLAAAGLILVIVLAVLLGRRGSTESTVSQPTALSAGVAYLESLEQKEPSEVEQQVKELHQKELEAQRAAMMEKLTSGKVDVWSLFEDYVILGDSRAVGFYYYGFLPEERVLAEGGATIRDIETHMDEIKALNPSSIFLCFGLNDISIGYWDSADEYVAEYKTVVENLKKEIPGVTVYVSSILPARDPAFDTASIWREIPSYSAALGTMCQENGIPFVDNDAISEEHSDLWDSDGIHLNKEFYPYWGANLMMAVYESAQDSEE